MKALLIPVALICIAGILYVAYTALTRSGGHVSFLGQTVSDSVQTAETTSDSPAVDQDSRFAPPVEPAAPDISVVTGRSAPAMAAAAKAAVAKPFDHHFIDQADGYGISYSAEFTVEPMVLDHAPSLVTMTNGVSGLGLQIQTTTVGDSSDNAITPARIIHDIPGMRVERPQVIRLTPQQSGLAFISMEGSQRSREVWFIHAGKLYQISAPIEMDPLIEKVLSTWKFI